MSKKKTSTDPLKPSIPILCKLGSIFAHVEELLSPKGHAFDKLELQKLLDDPEIKEWLSEMHKMALIPEKR